MNINEVLEEANIPNYLKTRKLLQQYQKAKRYILAGHFRNVGFKLRQPKEDDIYSFRINKQFRALCILKKSTLIVFKIDNHQSY